MSPRFRILFHAAGAAAAMASLSAQAATLTYDGAVYLPPQGCTFAEVSIPDNPPVSRPVLRGAPGVPTQAVVVSTGIPRGYRLVSYSYNFTGMDQRLPTNFAGIFLITSTEVIINKGPYWTLPIASDRVVTLNPSTVSWAGSAYEGPVSTSSPFYDSWSVRVISLGYQQATAGAPLKPAKVSWNCTMTIAPTPPPVFQQ